MKDFPSQLSWASRSPRAQISSSPCWLGGKCVVLPAARVHSHHKTAAQSSWCCYQSPKSPFTSLPQVILILRHCYFAIISEMQNPVYECKSQPALYKNTPEHESSGLCFIQQLLKIFTGIRQNPLLWRCLEFCPQSTWKIKQQSKRGVAESDWATPRQLLTPTPALPTIRKWEHNTTQKNLTKVFEHDVRKQC